MTTTPSRPQRIAVLGAESTGKTALTVALADALRARGLEAVVVPEYLREWCDRAGRTPEPQEQRDIAREQARRVLAVRDADFVIADTTPLMTAVYSERLFGDRSLHPFALAHQRQYDLTLLTGLDLPWVPDGIQRDGPHVREPVDTLLRTALHQSGQPWQVIYGHGVARLQRALDALFFRALQTHSTPAPDRNPSEATLAHGRWMALCPHCGDAAAERRLFRGMGRY
ncbi:nicotinamide riboside kinase [Tibeticola sediminis]|jgi:nicotinamide riboside kinase|uniref:Nicotinamide riboside kinase n=1 Tax=Tibeticola sediminis TaxID=1917811 RepID=A0A3N4UYW6_9BURK|nr:ATP-binding protein [Tibeticola sediminis]RPE72811.1 nicotinamide riboside kinase [Tibeticola sediminis]